MIGRPPGARGRLASFVACAGVALFVASLAPACTATANVSDVYASLDADGGRKRDVFYTDSKSIFCVAEIGIGRTDVTLEMIIRGTQRYDFDANQFRDVNFVQAYSELRPEKTSGARTPIPIELKRTSIGSDGKEKDDDEAPFVPGRYSCEALLDGEVKRTAAFNIEFPPCPTAMIHTGDPCYGFYKERTECPLNGLTGTQDPKCTCEKSGWQC